MAGLAVLLSQNFSHLTAPGLGAACTVVGAISFGLGTVWGEITLLTLGTFIFLILIANVLAYFLWFRILQIFPASVSGMGTLAVPIVGVIASSILLTETIGINELLALGLIIPALIINLKTS